MSNSQLSYEIYKWLNSLGIIQGNNSYNASGNFELDNKTRDQLLSGIALLKLVENISQQNKIKLNGPLLSSIKHSTSSASKLYNWNILMDCFLKLGIVLTKEIQKEILSSNFSTLVNFLTQIKNQFYPEKDKKNVPQNQLTQNKGRNIQNPEEAESVNQFIIFLIVKYLDLNPTQAQATLTENCKYFSHIVVKGIKGQHTKIIQFFQQFKQKMASLMFLCEKVPDKNHQLLLQLLRPTLISRNQDVAKVGCETFTLFIEQSLKYNSKNLVYQILSQNKAGFDFLYMGIKRHPQIIGQIFAFMLPLIRNAYLTFFQTQFKACIGSQSQYIKIILQLLPIMVANQQSKKLLFSSQTVQVWIQNCKNSFQLQSKQHQNQHSQIKLLYLQLLCQIGKSYCQDLSTEKYEELLIKTIQQLKKNTRKETYTIKFQSIYRLFDFLQFLALRKNKFAPLIYKKIIFLFVENHEDDDIKQVILENFTLILRKFPSIPLQYLLEPFLKQLTVKEGTSYILNIYDIQFFIQIAKHPKMDPKNALNFINFLSKLYIKVIIYSKLIFRVIYILTARFCEEEQFIQFFWENVDDSLNTYGMLVFAKKKISKEQVLINNQKKSLIIQLLKHQVGLEHQQLAELIKSKTVKLYTSWRQKNNHHDKGLESILSLFGDPETVCEEQTQKLQESYIFEEPSQNQKITINSLPLKKIKNTQSYDRQDFFRQNGIGYKKSTINQKSIPKNSKPDKKVLQTIQKIKEKVYQKKLMYQAKIQQKNQKKANASIGYNKLSNINEQKILYDFDEVKVRNTIYKQEFINLDDLQQRDKVSVKFIFEKYRKYLKFIFNRYSHASIDRKNTSIDDERMILSFTQLMRMLKQKGLNRIPKLIINEIIIFLNFNKRKQKNIIGGVYQEDFQMFILQLTYIFQSLDKTIVDLPLGIHVQKVIKSLLENQNLQIDSEDPKIIKYKQQFISSSEQPEVPQGYKKARQKELKLQVSFTFNNSKIGKNYLVCFQVVNQIYNKAMKNYLLPPNIVEKSVTTLHKILKLPKVKLTPNLTEKNLPNAQILKEEQQNEKSINKKVQKSKERLQFRTKKRKSLSHRNLQKSGTDLDQLDVANLQQKNKKDKEKEKEKKKQQAKIMLEKFKQDKTTKEQFKKKEEDQRKRKKQELRHAYLEQNKLKLKQQKQRQKQESEGKARQEEQKKEQNKLLVKKKQAEFLQMQRKAIQDKIERRKQKERIKQTQEQNSLNFLKNEKATNKVLAQLAALKDSSSKDQMIKSSLISGDLKEVVDKYEKCIQQLFQSYWIWDKQKIQLHSFALMLKDFQISPQFLLPRIIAEVYKNVAKGQILDYQGFKQCLGKLAYRSQKLIQQAPPQVQDQASEEQNYLNPEVLNLFFLKLRMDEPNYKIIIKQSKDKFKS